MVKSDKAELVLSELKISNALLRRSVTLDPNALLYAVQQAGHSATYIEILETIPSFIEELIETRALEQAFIHHFMTPTGSSTKSEKE